MEKLTGGITSQTLGVYFFNLSLLLPHFYAPHHLHRHHGNGAQHSITWDWWHNCFFPGAGLLFPRVAPCTAGLALGSAFVFLPHCGWGRLIGQCQRFRSSPSGILILWGTVSKKMLSPYFKVAGFPIVLFSVLVNNALLFPFFPFPSVQSSFPQSVSIA